MIPTDEESKLGNGSIALTNHYLRSAFRWFFESAQGGSTSTVVQGHEPMDNQYHQGPYRTMAPRVEADLVQSGACDRCGYVSERACSLRQAYCGEHYEHRE